MSNNNSDVGVFSKQESVMSLYEPAPMSPTSSKTFSNTQMPAVAQNGSKSDSRTAMKRNVSYGNLTAQAEARVLVLYTGMKSFNFT